jgi:hypothetical protein
MRVKMLAVAAIVATAAAGALALQASGADQTPSAAAAQVRDIDADLIRPGRLRMEAETAGASRVTFSYRGRSYGGRLDEIDREYGTRDWSHTVRARRGDRRAGRLVTVRVRACTASRCTSTSHRERLEWDD